MQVEHTRAKRARKSPVITSPDSSEGKPEINLVQFTSAFKNIQFTKGKLAFCHQGFLFLKNITVYIP